MTIKVQLASFVTSLNIARYRSMFALSTNLWTPRQALFFKNGENKDENPNSLRFTRPDGLPSVPTANRETCPSLNTLKLLSCVLLLFFNVSATAFTEASRLDDGTYPYNTFVIPFAAEVLKLLFLRLVFEFASLKSNLSLISLRGFWKYSISAWCYFVNNNCTFHIIQHLGATTFQITNNLKVLSTGLFMHVSFNESSAGCSRRRLLSSRSAPW